jgi:hypothetical protein
MVYGNTMSNFDHYAEASNLIDHLSVDGHPIEAAILKSALEDGATGTEILMALRFHLSGIIRRVSLTGASQIIASRLLSELNEVLE